MRRLTHGRGGEGLVPVWRRRESIRKVVKRFIMNIHFNMIAYMTTFMCFSASDYVRWCRSQCDLVLWFMREKVNSMVRRNVKCLTTTTNRNEFAESVTKGDTEREAQCARFFPTSPYCQSQTPKPSTCVVTFNWTFFDWRTLESFIWIARCMLPASMTRWNIYM